MEEGNGHALPSGYGPGRTNCYLLLFDSPHQALRAEGVLRREEIPHTVVNTPREFSLHCGISLRVPFRWAEAAERALRREDSYFRDMVPYFSPWIESDEGTENGDGVPDVPRGQDDEG